MSKINVCFATDNTYAPYMGITMFSILKNAAPDDDLSFYILDGGIEPSAKAQIEKLKDTKDFNIEYLPMDDKQFDNLHLELNYITKATFYRFLIPDLLPNVDKILYLDCDLMVLKSLRPLFDTDITGFGCAGVSDVMPEEYVQGHFKGAIKPGCYVNAGVLLINCAYWRENQAASALFEYVKSVKPKFADQDAINFIFRGKIKLLPAGCNTMAGHFENISSKAFIPNIIIRHFTCSDKPWKAHAFQPMTDVYRAYMAESAWADLMQKLPEGSLYWSKQFFKYWFVHPVFFLKPKFYRKCYRTGIKMLLTRL